MKKNHAQEVTSQLVKSVGDGKLQAYDLQREINDYDFKINNEKAQLRAKQNEETEQKKRALDQLF